MCQSGTGNPTAPRFESQYSGFAGRRVIERHRPCCGSKADLEALRQALGANQIVLIGHNYGTHLAFALIKRHGAHVTRAVLVGVRGLEQRWREPVESDHWLTRVAASVRNNASTAISSIEFAGFYRSSKAILLSCS